MTDHDKHLARCVELAREALAAGDDPFGSLLVSSEGDVLVEFRNREQTDADPTAHPELDIATWAWRNLDAEQRASSTVYTTGEHCPMCAAAHGWVGLGAIVFAVASTQLAEWRTSWGLPGSPVAPLPVSTVLPGTPVTGPVASYVDPMFALHEQAARRVGG
ncbi:nucleoside deaminase [Nocardioides panacisoli]|uniref:Nucleoside deaminase n=1 Tax=Nocardioides panacisoli TaxID=627624 RepID=A0ABP7I4E1_9ACTN